MCDARHSYGGPWPLRDPSCSVHMLETDSSIDLWEMELSGKLHLLLQVCLGSIISLNIYRMVNFITKWLEVEESEVSL